MRLQTKYLAEKLKQLDTYITTLIVGSFVNLYGQLLVPILRGETEPLQSFLYQFKNFPISVLLSVFLGYAFPFLVNIFTGVYTRYQHRIYESQALFPALKPDPVFRSNPDGKIILAGENTQKILDQYSIKYAQDILGKETWEKILLGHEEEIDVYVPSIKARFIVVYARTKDGLINIYMTERRT